MDTIVGFSCKVGGVGDDGGIDYQGPGPIVVTHSKSGPGAIRREPAGYRAFNPIELLVNERLSLAHLRAPGGGDEEGAVSWIYFDPLGPFEVKRDPARVCARRHQEVVLEFAPFAVIDEIDSRIDLRVRDLLEGWHVPDPFLFVRPPEIIDLSGQRFHAVDGRVRVGAYETHAHDRLRCGPLRRALLPLALCLRRVRTCRCRKRSIRVSSRWSQSRFPQDKDCFGLGEEGFVAGPPGSKLNLRIELAAIHLE